MPKKEIKLVEIARSFSYKMGLPKFENRDFFCSEKAEVPESEAEKTSEALYQFCKKEVIKSVNEYKAEMAALTEPAKHEPLPVVDIPVVDIKEKTQSEELGREKLPIINQ